MCVKTGGTQLFRQLSVLLARHVNHYRRVLGDGIPFKGRTFLGAEMVAQKHYLGCQPAIRKGNPCRGSRAKRGSDSRYDLEIDSGASQGFHFLAGAAIQQWVASLQANTVSPWFASVTIKELISS